MPARTHFYIPNPAVMSQSLARLRENLERISADSKNIYFTLANIYFVNHKQILSYLEEESHKNSPESLRVLEKKYLVEIKGKSRENKLR